MTPDIDPVDLAALVRAVSDRAVVGFDVDGVLAPIVGHADDARLTAGAGADLARLAATVDVAVVSGRSLADLQHRFDFDPTIHLIGSHGLEVRGDPALDLSGDELTRLEHIGRLALDAADRAGPGSWVEHKPASVAVHTRNADARLARRAIDDLLQIVETDGSIPVTRGHEVVELFARPASKGRALDALRHRLGRQVLVYLGDDVTDESVFAVMGEHDLGVRVGPGDTLAHHRLAGPADVAVLLRLIADRPS